MAGVSAAASAGSSAAVFLIGCLRRFFGSFFCRFLRFGSGQSGRLGVLFGIVQDLGNLLDGLRGFSMVSMVCAGLPQAVRLKASKSASSRAVILRVMVIPPFVFD